MVGGGVQRCEGDDICRSLESNVPCKELDLSNTLTDLKHRKVVELFSIMLIYLTLRGKFPKMFPLSRKKEISGLSKKKSKPSRRKLEGL